MVSCNLGLACCMAAWLSAWHSKLHRQFAETQFTTSEPSELPSASASKSQRKPNQSWMLATSRCWPPAASIALVEDSRPMSQSMLVPTDWPARPAETARDSAAVAGRQRRSCRGTTHEGLLGPKPVRSSSLNLLPYCMPPFGQRC